jgi:hypothetical protein
MVSSGGGVHPVWRGDGRELYYWRDGALVAVPALLYPDPETCARFALVFAPAAGPVAG